MRVVAGGRAAVQVLNTACHELLTVDIELLVQSYQLFFRSFPTVAELAAKLAGAALCVLRSAGLFRKHILFFLGFDISQMKSVYHFELRLSRVVRVQHLRLQVREVVDVPSLLLASLCACILLLME